MIDISKSKKKKLGILGIAIVLGSWVLVPILGKIYFGVSSIESGFLLTVFYVVVWTLFKIYRKFIR